EPESPDEAVVNVELGGRRTARLDERRVGAALDARQRAVDQGDARLRVADRESPARPPAARRPEREERGRATPAERDPCARRGELPVREVPGLGPASPAEAELRAPGGADLGRCRPEPQPAEAVTGDEDAEGRQAAWKRERGGGEPGG